MTATTDFRNVALVGHGNAGKTSIAEAMLFKAKVTSRLGKVDEGSSHLDYEDDEKEKGYTISSALGRLEWKKTTVNVIDTPGKPDFLGEVAAAIPFVETAIVTIAANAGVQVNTRNAMKLADARGRAKMILVTKVDAENVNIDDLLGVIAATFGDRCVPVNYPRGEGTGFQDICSVLNPPDDAPEACATYRDTLMERAVEADEELMEKFLDTMELSDEEFHAVLKKAVAGGVVVPVLFAAVPQDKGVEELLDFLVEYGPSPLDVPRSLSAHDAQAYVGYRAQVAKIKAGSAEQAEGGESVEEEAGEIPASHGVMRPEDVPLPAEMELPVGFVAQVFKVTIDQHVGRFTFLRVWQGELAGDADFYNPQTEKTEKNPGFHVVVAGNERKKIDQVVAGDIVVLVKLETLHLWDTVTSGAKAAVRMPWLPTPMVSYAIFPKTQKDVDRIGDALRKMTEEDPCFLDRVDPITKERVISGMSELHLGIKIERLKTRYKAEVDYQLPKVPYQETCTATASGAYRHKKQSGGAGEFAEVHVEVAPNERGAGYEFIDAIVGGAIDRPFIPAVDKGVRDQCAKGVLAGFPVVDIKVKLYDGKTHPVDSKDRAFQKAGREALKEIFPKCKPRLLEPYMEMQVTVPTDSVGDILSDLSGSRRGHVLDQTQEGMFTTLKAHAPLAEVQTYSQTLQSVTGGEGFYTMVFSHYDLVPDQIAQQVVAKYKKAEEEAD